jgi:hypothetical protein
MSGTVLAAKATTRGGVSIIATLTRMAMTTDMNAEVHLEGNSMVQVPMKMSKKRPGASDPRVGEAGVLLTMIKTTTTGAQSRSGRVAGVPSSGLTARELVVQRKVSATIV